jgi:hypothetical protein
LQATLESKSEPSKKLFFVEIKEPAETKPLIWAELLADECGSPGVCDLPQYQSENCRTAHEKRTDDRNIEANWYRAGRSLGGDVHSNGFGTE